MSSRHDIVRIDASPGITVWHTAIASSSDRSGRREAEREAVAGLVAAAFVPEARLMHKESGAPYILTGDGCDTLHSVSISHCSDTAMLAVAPEGTAIGIDCEHFRKALRNVAPRVLSADEMPGWTASDTLLLRAWTIKEAVYKAAGIPGLPLAEGIRLPQAEIADNAISDIIAATADGRRFRLIFLPDIAPSTTIAVAL
ncbi:4'-phosphopantetheinyl transferase superfamily protein [Muribaculaceae bacterium Isolate-042 (Harlan)]|uniref:4'-phosphopantetheinyl transferase family protein n=1 Tax=Muribaculum intestinale TaxID=1796646 RepID=UPI000F490884|nr:4'-phosphopantetheinyl transferase family protein [Muribaculum intestinale]MCX4369513.1 4'-phosphopantetheinyl transferase superfamily protein [Duncaniella sp.]ROS80961.1 4'-phosphopantetheinyl transferase superfamily protein [Muribaculaceae bacterium Isolate-042 (Harlan)]